MVQLLCEGMSETEESYKFTFHYGSITICWKYDKPAMAMIFTFHYGSITILKK